MLGYLRRCVRVGDIRYNACVHRFVVLVSISSSLLYGRTSPFLQLVSISPVRVEFWRTLRQWQTRGARRPARTRNCGALPFLYPWEMHTPKLEHLPVGLLQLGTVSLTRSSIDAITQRSLLLPFTRVHTAATRQELPWRSRSSTTTPLSSSSGCSTSTPHHHHPKAQLQSQRQALGRATS